MKHHINILFAGLLRCQRDIYLSFLIKKIVTQEKICVTVLIKEDRRVNSWHIFFDQSNINHSK